MPCRPRDARRRAPAASGVQRVVDAAHVEYLDGRQRAAVDPARADAAGVSATALSGRGVALPGEHHRVVLLRPPERDRAGVVARVALVLVGARRAPRRRRSGRCRRAARTPPSEARRTRAPRPRAAGATRRAARPDRAPSAAPRPRRRTAREPPDGLRRQADLGDEHDRATAGGERRLRPRAGTPRSCPSRSRRASRNRRRGPRSSAPRTASSARCCSSVSAGGAVEPPLRSRPRPADGAWARELTRRAAPLEPPQRGGPERGRGRAARRAARSSASAGRRSARAALERLAPPASVSSATSTCLRRTPPAAPGGEHQRQRPRRRRAVLGAPSSPRARPGRPGTSGREDRLGLGEPLGRELGCLWRARPRPRASCADRTAPEQRADRDIPGRGATGSRTGPGPRACSVSGSTRAIRFGVACSACIVDRRVSPTRMTADSPAQSTREPVPGRSDRAELACPPHDPVDARSPLGEVGRRHHLFAWLAPGAGRR